MTTHIELSRRRFLEVTGGAAAGLTLGFHVPAMVRGIGGRAPRPPCSTRGSESPPMTR